jgi:hypothetical protein
MIGQMLQLHCILKEILGRGKSIMSVICKGVNGTFGNETRENKTRLGTRKKTKQV